MNFKLGFGPMSDVIVDTLVDYANAKESPLMIIASRNQVDADSGYVMTTKQLSERVAPEKTEFIRLCRDHCGPYFLDAEKELSLHDAVEATKKTIAADIENGFDLIHIDTSRCVDGYGGYRTAEELIKFCLQENPNILFEFGTEENVGVAAGVSKYQEDVKFASQFRNMQYVVAQTGSLTMEDKQVGKLEVENVKKLVGYANEAGIKLKEHNADYLTKNEIQQRSDIGVHALNIAPQLGVIQTKIILKLALQYGIDSLEFKELVLDSGKWKKWHIDSNDDKKVDFAGHYCYNSNVFKRLVSGIPDWQDEVASGIVDCLDLYYNNL
jgi:hypothetical protein